MYVPLPYQEDRQDILIAAIRARSFGALISTGCEGIRVSHVPFVIQSNGSAIRLVCHLARANPQWMDLKAGGEVVVSFVVEDGYISPVWYPSKAETGRVVPTWNYIAVEARGVPTVLDSRDDLLALVDALTADHEGGRAAPWSTADAPDTYIDALLRGIVGVRIELATLTGAWKLDQKKSAADRNGVAEGLQHDGNHSLAQVMSKGTDH